MERTPAEIENDAIHALNENDVALMRSVALELEAMGRDEDASAVRSQAQTVEGRE